MEKQVEKKKANAGAVRFQQIPLKEESKEREKRFVQQEMPKKKEIGFGGLRDRRWVHETIKDILRRNYFCISLQLMSRRKDICVFLNVLNTPEERIEFPEYI
ncbi:hypothetical protein CEXT_304261 [Caerostris extrusa]|uniref:Uncharacterized protein n=1 Tax=Caerostris extrusa TaxID=172846 RepID=A0AAV4SLI6_CAEEX|nr:hypothetical protein CEXT_304261 [Caerostris extrusa]